MLKKILEKLQLFLKNKTIFKRFILLLIAIGLVALFVLSGFSLKYKNFQCEKTKPEIPKSAEK